MLITVTGIGEVAKVETGVEITEEVEEKVDSLSLV